MKKYFNKISAVPLLGAFLLAFTLLTSCEQTDYPPNLSAAPGGGTISTYKAYTLASTDSKNVYGRVVFYKYSAAVTLVQMGLYNGTADASYTSAIFPGKVTATSATALKALDSVNGSTGEFATAKYFTITDSGFYDKLDTYDANVVVMAGTAIIASGNIGANAAPVSKSE